MIVAARPVAVALAQMTGSRAILWAKSMAFTGPDGHSPHVSFEALFPGGSTEP
jgi:hypothetical protein